MRLGKKQMLLVLPKRGFYESKDFESKEFLETKVKEALMFAQKLGAEVYCFAEDELAVMLIEPEAVSWLSVLSNSDKLCYDTFDLGRTDIQKSKYRLLKQESVDEQIIRRCLEKIPVVSPRSFSSQDEYTSARINVLRDHIRWTCNEFMAENVKFIYYIDGHFNYCGKPSTVLSDGRWVLTEDIEHCRTLCEYSGIALDVDVFIQSFGGQ